jgi:hypothetical protein
MSALKYCSWAAYALGGFLFAAALATEAFFLLAPAIAAAISGVLFAALERIIALLSDIRDSLQPPLQAANLLAAIDLESTTATVEPTSASIAKLTASLDAAKRRQGGA